MASQVTLGEAAMRLPELVREGHEAVLSNGSQPVAGLTPLGGDVPNAGEPAAVAGGAFDRLADEPDLYDDTCGKAIR